MGVSQGSPALPDKHEKPKLKKISPSQKLKKCWCAHWHAHSPCRLAGVQLSASWWAQCLTSSLSPQQPGKLCIKQCPVQEEKCHCDVPLSRLMAAASDPICRTGPQTQTWYILHWHWSLEKKTKGSTSDGSKYVSLPFVFGKEFLWSSPGLQMQ